MSKFVIKDEESGEEYQVEEVIETPAAETSTKPVADETPALSEEDIKALKMLAGIADKLVSLATTKTEEVEEVIEDSEEDIVEESVKAITQDSKKSVGAIEKTKTKQIDSLDDRETEIANAWAKRYGGTK